MIPILEGLSESRKLTNINLSWNSLCENPNYAPIGSVCQNFQELESRKSFRKRTEPKGKTAAQLKIEKMLGMDDSMKQKNFNEQEKKVVELIQHLLMKNGKLIHFDLSETMLSEDMILELAKAVKYS